MKILAALLLLAAANVYGQRIEDLDGYIHYRPAEVESRVILLPRVDGVLLEHTCWRHGDVMAVELVPVVYGLSPNSGSFVSLSDREDMLSVTTFVDFAPILKQLPSYLDDLATTEYFDAKSEEFPNARPYVLGGCTIGSDREAEEYICAKCRKAREAWMAAHPKFQPPLP